MYRFHFIEGISRTDTPLFNNLSEQNVYFNKNTMLQIDEYYPPHYTNVIKCSVADINFNTRVNYVSLRHFDKWYYYFITSCNYVNEDIIEITINMDTFQTFMFDIEFHNARVSRKLIKRWNNGNINRNYIRENFSSGIFVNYFYKDYTIERLGNGDGGVLLCKYIPSNVGSIVRYATEVISEFTRYKDNSLIKILPAFNFAIGNKEYRNINIAIDGGLNEIITPLAYNEFMYSLQSDPDNFILYYIPFNPFVNVEISKTIIGDMKCTLWNFKNDDNNSFNITGDNKYVEASICEINTINRDVVLDFVQNSDRQVLFNSKYVPQMLDENYIRVYYGEKAHMTTYPMNKLTKPKLYTKYYCDILTGYRTIALLDNLQDIDKYNTTLVLNGYIQVPMVNDNWKNYMSTHVGTITSDVGKFIYNSLGSLNGGGSSASRALSGIGPEQVYSEVVSGSTSVVPYKQNQLVKHRIYDYMEWRAVD